jgi:translation initiation factor 1A
MPANIHGGKKFKKGKKGGPTQRELITKEPEQYYARVQKLLGGDRILAVIETTKQAVMCHVRGSMKRKKQWVNSGDVILISDREYQPGKYDVLVKYTQEEVRELRKKGHLKTNTFENDSDNKYTNIQFVGEEVEENCVESVCNINPQNRDYDLPSSDEEESEYDEEEYEEPAYETKPKKKASDDDDSDVDIDNL